MHRLSAYVIVHRTQSDQTANAIQLDGERNSIGRRTESDWTANATRRLKYRDCRAQVLIFSFIFRKGRHRIMKHNIRNFIVLLAAGALLTATPQGSSFLTEPTGKLVAAAVENHGSKKTTENASSSDKKEESASTQDNKKENSQSDLGLSSVLGILTPEPGNGNEEQPIKRPKKKKQPKRGQRRR